MSNLREAIKGALHKQPKSEVDYGPGRREAHCGICKHFQKPDACKLVSGKIRPSGWCKLFSALRRA